MPKTTDGPETKLLHTLRKLNPAKVRVYASESDDKPRDIAVPTRRRKWAAVIEAIEARAWVSCEMLDKGGAVLGYVDNNSPAGELQELPDHSLDNTNRGQLTLAERIVRMNADSVRDALRNRDAETRAMMDAQTSVMRTLTESVQGLAAVYRAQAEAFADVADARQEAAEIEAEAAANAAAAAASAGGDMKQLMEAIPLLVQAVPMLKALLAGGNSPSH